MGGAGQEAENTAGVGFVLGLADDLAVQPAHRIGRQHDAVGETRGDRGGLQPGDLLHERTRIGAIRAGRLFDVRGQHFETVACLGE